MTLALAATLPALRNSAGFSPLALFAKGEAGVWFDPEDILSYMATGPELVVNGDFSSSASWSLGAGWTISGGVANANTAGVASMGQSVNIVAGRSYLVKFTATRVSGNMNCYLGGTLATSISAGGDFSVVVKAGSVNTLFNFEALNAAVYTIDNASVRELPSISNATMYQDATGTTPVTAVEQPVGLILDKSNKLVLGAELKQTGATGQQGTATAAAYNTTTGVGTASRVDASNRSFVTFTTTATAGYRLSIQNTGSTALSVSAGNGTVSVAAGTTKSVLTNGASIYLYAEADAATASFTVQTLKLLSGDHAAQQTAAKRPVLSARVNLALASEDFSAAAWAKSSVVLTSNAVAAPDGALTADRLADSTWDAYHYAYQNVAIDAGANIALVYLKAGEKTLGGIQLFSTTPSVNSITTFDLATKAAVVKTTNGLTNVSATMVDVGGGWYRCEMRFTISAAASVMQFRILPNNGDLYIGDGVSGIYAWGTDIRHTNDGAGGIPVYQRVADAATYDATGFPHYLKFDGVDDSLATASIDFSATDKMSVHAGVRKVSDASPGVFLELGAAGVTANGAFGMQAPNSAVNSYRYEGKGTGAVTLDATGFAAPVTSVLTGQQNISGPSLSLRVNGVQAAAASTTQGTGNFLANPLYLGARAGTALLFNGRLYQVIVRGAYSTYSEITSTEAYVNSKTRAY